MSRSKHLFLFVFVLAGLILGYIYWRSFIEKTRDNVENILYSARNSYSNIINTMNILLHSITNHTSELPENVSNQTLVFSGAIRNYDISIHNSSLLIINSYLYNVSLNLSRSIVYLVNSTIEQIDINLDFLSSLLLFGTSINLANFTSLGCVFVLNSSAHSLHYYGYYLRIYYSRLIGIAINYFDYLSLQIIGSFIEEAALNSSAEVYILNSVVASSRINSFSLVFLGSTIITSNIVCVQFIAALDSEFVHTHLIASFHFYSNTRLKESKTYMVSGLSGTRIIYNPYLIHFLLFLISVAFICLFYNAIYAVVTLVFLASIIIVVGLHYFLFVISFVLLISFMRPDYTFYLVSLVGILLFLEFRFVLFAIYSLVFLSLMPFAWDIRKTGLSSLDKIFGSPSSKNIFTIKKLRNSNFVNTAFYNFRSSKFTVQKKPLSFREVPSISMFSFDINCCSGYYLNYGASLPADLYPAGFVFEVIGVDSKILDSYGGDYVFSVFVHEISHAIYVRLDIHDIILFFFIRTLIKRQKNFKEILLRHFSEKNIEHMLDPSLGTEVFAFFTSKYWTLLREGNTSKVKAFLETLDHINTLISDFGFSGNIFESIREFPRFLRTFAFRLLLDVKMEAFFLELLKFFEVL